MSDDADSLVRHSAIYLLAALLNRGLGVALVMLYTRFMAPEEYGAVGVALITAEIVGSLLSVQIADAMARFWFDHGADADRDRVIGSAIRFLLALIVTSIPLLVALRPWAGELIFADARYGWLLVVGVPAILSDALFQVMQHQQRAERRSGAVLAWSTLRSVLLLGCNVPALLWWPGGALGALGALAVANATVAVGLALPALRRATCRFDAATLRSMLGYGCGLSPAYACEAGGKFAERTLALRVVGEAASGIYFLAFRLADLLGTVIVRPFAQIYAVSRFEAHRDGRDDPDAARHFTGFFAFLALCCTGLSLLAPEAVAVLAPPRYAAAVPLVPAMALAVLVFGLSLIVELGIYFRKRTSRITLATAMSLIVQLPLLWWATTRWGIIGTAWARAAGLGVRIAVTWWCARGLGGPRPQWGAVVGILVLTTGTLILGTTTLDLGAWTGLGARLALFTAFAAALWFGPLLEPGQRAWLTERLRRRLRRRSASTAMTSTASTHERDHEQP